jgi:nicotinamide-nucleotide amidase
MTAMPPRPDDAPPDGPATVVRSLLERGLSLATAESLTGGAVAAAVVSVPGASNVYVGGVVTYATELKLSLLGVPRALVESDGVVSAACARVMAERVRSLTGADVGVSTTGVAGPDPQEGKAPGTVFVAVAGPGDTRVRALVLTGDRAAVRAATVEEALAAVLAAVREDGLGPGSGTRPGPPPQVGAGE